VQDAAGTERASLPLAGQTLAGALEWLGGALGETGARVPAGGLELPGYELPDHPVASGGAFAGASPAGRAELAAWFANGHAVLEAAAAREGGSEVRTWPHHFDVGSLITVATNPDGSLAASVGLGLSPGDSSYPEPYWYISPWPYPAADALPGLAAGHWHTEGFAAAILTATEQLEAGGDPARTLDAFLSDAISKSRQSLA